MEDSGDNDTSLFFCFDKSTIRDGGDTSIDVFLQTL